MTTRVDDLVDLLDEFLAATPGVEAVAVVSPDGWPIVCATPEWLDERRLAAMSSALVVLGERAVAELGKGGVDHVYVQGTHGDAALMPAGASALVVVTTYPGARTGLVLYELRRTAMAVARVMDVDVLGMQQGPPAPQIVDLAEAERVSGR
jgi:predicted regulator of Ras-like GTPase activity (Roadblock/LC7/MglB family)